MKFEDWTSVFNRKVAGYDLFTCTGALQDCHETLKIWGEGIDPAYGQKLWAEIDCLRDRQRRLK